MKLIVRVCMIALFATCGVFAVEDPPKEEAKEATPSIDEDDPHGLIAYSRYLDGLAKDAKKPAKGSQFVGRWIGERGEKAHFYLFAADGTFSYNFGHNKGKGRWRQCKKTVILLCFDADPPKVVDFKPHKLAFIEGDVFKTHEFDYTNDYVRSPKKVSPKSNQQPEKKKG